MNNQQQEEQNSIGYHKWLIETIRANCAGGSELVEQSKPLGKSKQYKWLLAQLSERGEVEIVEGFHRRRRAEVNARSWQKKCSRLERLDERIANRKKADLHGTDSYSLQLEKNAAKLRSAIEKHEKQQGEEINVRAEL